MIYLNRFKIRTWNRRRKNGNFAWWTRLLPIKKKKIVFTSHHGNGFGDSPKYIALALLDKEFELVWLVRQKNAAIPSGIRQVEYGTRKALYELATAEIWIDNCRKRFYPPKKEAQVYIQTWHSPLRLKQIERDAEQELPSAYVIQAKQDAKMCDYMISGSSFSTELYRNSFWFKGEILEVGTPRCDLFFQVQHRSKDRTRYVLYAPTFRENSTTDAYLKDFERVRKALQRLGYSEWKVWVRLHPNLRQDTATFDFTFSENVIDMSDYPDIQELLNQADWLITDYSSSMFDQLIARKRCLLYVPDEVVYQRQERSFYFKLDELPFPKSRTIQELEQAIVNWDETAYQRDVAAFHTRVETYETGHATEKIVQKIQEICKGDNYA
ncbi:CDP-glycerol glycerophosphotransferase family protein [Listeria booriae]|uniref:CDP-glycerol glycerophosphotransferase family protein n=1 Tax=Listeria booriae TaxID=1552123 RepID=UPI0021ADDF1A|nr:CDP-glycerol glycerophosphotransferase family protein [Listeria booriae]